MSPLYAKMNFSSKASNLSVKYWIYYDSFFDDILLNYILKAHLSPLGFFAGIKAAFSLNSMIPEEGEETELAKLPG